MILSSKQFLRYERHIELHGYGEAKQKDLLQSRVLIIGAGGLGCPVSLYLCASGVGHITIVDDDIVSLSNLQRQILYKTHDEKKGKAYLAKKYLSELNEDCVVEVVEERITRDNVEPFIRNIDIVIDATDNFETRYLLNEFCLKYKKPLISGAVIHYDGQVSVFKGYKKDLPCYQCAYPAKPKPHEVPSCSESAVLSPVVGVVGTLMAVECIKELLSLGQSSAGTLNLYSGLTCQMSKISIEKSKICNSCWLCE